jgi:hypothetical protein
MEPPALEFAILRLLELQEKMGKAAYLEDAVIAAVTAADLDEVHRQLEILAHQQFVQLVKLSPTSYAAAITYHKPRLRLIGGSLKCCYCALHRGIATEETTSRAPMATNHEEPVNLTGHNAEVLRRQPDGSWTFVIDNP